jgi:ribosome-associated protein
MDESWSRTDEKRKNRLVEATLERLARDIVRVPEKKLAELALSEELHDEILTLQRIKSPPARNRQRRLVRALLRDDDWGAIDARVKALLAGGSASVTASDPALARLEANWIMRLIGEGSVGLDAFLAEFPQADRTHLRQLVRSVAKATHERKTKAEEKLRASVRGFLR